MYCIPPPVLSSVIRQSQLGGKTSLVALADDKYAVVLTLAVDERGVAEAKLLLINYFQLGHRFVGIERVQRKVYVICVVDVTVYVAILEPRIVFS